MSNNSPDFFTLNGKKIYFNNISSIREKLTESENKTVDIIEKWINEEKYFTLHTSGSTGIPKPIILNREQMLISAKMTAEFLNLRKGDKSLICLPTQYVAGLMMIVRSLVVGMEMVILNPDSYPLESIDINEIFDFTALLPLQLYEIFKHKDKIKILDNMKSVLIGGGSISSELEEKIQELKVPVYNTYAMTETVTHIALRRVNGKEKNNYFTVLNNVEINKDERGCLTIKSPITNNQTIITNDIVEIISDRDFIWKGRIDNVINTGGIKVQAEKVENAIEKVFYKNKITDKFFVSSEKNDKFGNVVICIVETNNFSEKLTEKVKDDLLEYLSKYEIPKKFYFADKILLTESGKIDKIKTLKNLFQTF